MSLSKQTIEKTASYGGASGCAVDFLKSQAVAEKVADTLWQNLRKGNRSLERSRVKVLPSVMHAGTWMVRYRCIPLASGVPGAKAINARRGGAIKQAVKASYASGDLVDSWTV